MASYVDLGLVRDLRQSDLSSYEECYFFCSPLNGHLYAAFREEDLREFMGDQGSRPIQRIDGIRKQFFNIDQVESVGTFTLTQREIYSISGVSFWDVGADINLEASLISPISSKKPPKVFPSELQIQKILEATTDIARSLDGTDGVYFLDSASESDHSLVLKCYSEPERAMDEVVADRFFQYFGFITPPVLSYILRHFNLETCKK